MRTSRSQMTTVLNHCGYPMTAVNFTSKTVAVLSMVLMSATFAQAATLQVDIGISDNPLLQSGWSEWNTSTAFNATVESTTFAYADTTDGTLDASLTPLTDGGGRNYGIGNVSDPGNLTIPDVWADLYFTNNNNSDELELKLDDLKAGTYTFTSYSYASPLNSGDSGTVSVFVGGIDTTLDVTMVTGATTAANLDTNATVSFQFSVPNDDDTVSIVYKDFASGDSFGINGFELEAASVVPEPSALALAALGLLGLMGVRRRRR